MDQEKIKKVVIAVWVIALFVFGGYVIRLYAKGVDGAGTDYKSGSYLEYQDINPEVNQYSQSQEIID